MATRANWHTATINVDTTDPFATPEPEPFERLQELVRAECRLDDQGVTCELKDRDWSRPSCVGCPKRGAHGALCGIGVAQEQTLAAMA